MQFSGRDNVGEYDLSDGLELELDELVLELELEEVLLLVLELVLLLLFCLLLFCLLLFVLENPLTVLNVDNYLTYFFVYLANILIIYSISY